MEKHVTTDKFHSQLVKDLFHTPPTDEQVLCLMLLFHACHLCLSDVADVAGGVRGFEGITTRHAAEVVASLFGSGDKSDPGYWHDLWNGGWQAYAILENPPWHIIPMLLRMRDTLESHPWVERLDNEDWEILPSEVE
jgi:hypothetical protein